MIRLSLILILSFPASFSSVIAQPASSDYDRILNRVLAVEEKLGRVRKDKLNLSGNSVKNIDKKVLLSIPELPTESDVPSSSNLNPEREVENGANTFSADSNGPSKYEQIYQRILQAESRLQSITPIQTANEEDVLLPEKLPKIELNPSPESPKVEMTELDKGISETPLSPSVSEMANPPVPVSNSGRKKQEGLNAKSTALGGGSKYEQIYQRILQAESRLQSITPTPTAQEEGSPLHRELPKVDLALPSVPPPIEVTEIEEMNPETSLNSTSSELPTPPLLNLENQEQAETQNKPSSSESDKKFDGLYQRILETESRLQKLNPDRETTVDITDTLPESPILEINESTTALPMDLTDNEMISPVGSTDSLVSNKEELSIEEYSLPKNIPEPKFVEEKVHQVRFRSAYALPFESSYIQPVTGTSIPLSYDNGTQFSFDYLWGSKYLALGTSIFWNKSNHRHLGPLPPLPQLEAYGHTRSLGGAFLAMLSTGKERRLSAEISTSMGLARRLEEFRLGLPNMYESEAGSVFTFGIDLGVNYELIDELRLGLFGKYQHQGGLTRISSSENLQMGLSVIRDF